MLLFDFVRKSSERVFEKDELITNEAIIVWIHGRGACASPSATRAVLGSECQERRNQRRFGHDFRGATKLNFFVPPLTRRAARRRRGVPTAREPSSNATSSPSRAWTLPTANAVSAARRLRECGDKTNRCRNSSRFSGITANGAKHPTGVSEITASGGGRSDRDNSSTADR